MLDFVKLLYNTLKMDDSYDDYFDYYDSDDYNDYDYEYYYPNSLHDTDSEYDSEFENYDNNVSDDDADDNAVDDNKGDDNIGDDLCLSDLEIAEERQENSEELCYISTMTNYLSHRKNSLNDNNDVDQDKDK